MDKKKVSVYSLSVEIQTRPVKPTGCQDSEPYSCKR